VPKLHELKVRHIQSLAYADEELSRHLPNESSKVLNRDYLFNVPNNNF
jgi:hypothetical protein